MYKLNIKKFIILIVLPVLLIFAVIMLLVIRPWAGEHSARRAPGEAEAIMTTKILVYDGLWESTRHSDELYYPIGLALMDGNIVVADSKCDRIQILDGDRNLRIGSPGQFGLSYRDSGALIDGYRENAMFMKPSGVFVCPSGTIIITDTNNHVIRKMDDEFVITIAGNGSAGFSDGKEGDAQFNHPRSAVMCPDGFITLLIR